MNETRERAVEARRVIYRSLASLFLYPDDNRLAAIAAAAPELRARAEPLRGSELLPAWDALLTDVEELSEDTAEQLREAYTGLFVSGARGRSCPPYGSAYSPGGPESAGLVSATVCAEYTAAGLRVADSGELPDHLAIELDFLSFLCGKEAEVENTAGWARRRRAFLDRHLLPWLPRFADALDGVAPGSLYASAARTALAFARADRATIDVAAALAG